MGMDFPAPATPGQIYAPPGGPVYKFTDPVWTVVESLPVTGLGNEAFVQSPTGGFAENNPAYPPRVHRMADRIYVGDGVGMVANWPSPTGLDPVTNKLHSWAGREATIWCDAPNGGMSIVGHAQRSKRTKASLAGYTTIDGVGIGVSGFAINDSVGAATGGAWGGYFEAVRFPSAGFTVGVEVEVANLGTWLNMNPFNVKATGGTGATANNAGVALWLAAGAGLDANGYDGSYGTSTDVAAAIAMLSSHATDNIKFGKGIVIAAGALRDLGGGLRSAFEMPANHMIQWYRLNGTTPEAAAYIWEQGTTAAQASLGIRFGSDGLTLRSGSTALVRFLPIANAVNNLIVTPSAAGGSLAMLAEGSDTNISVVIRPKGVNELLLQSGDASNKIRVNNTGIGFFGNTPVARPTGVAVTDAAIHAALVTLGLIAA